MTIMKHSRDLGKHARDLERLEFALTISIVLLGILAVGAILIG